MLSTSAVSFILAITTVVRYRFLFKKYQNNVTPSIRHDVLLFSQAVIVLLFQLALAGYYVMVLVARIQSLPNLQAIAFFFFGYISDAISLINPIALIIACNFIRKDYYEFVLQGKTFLTPIVWTSTHGAT